MDYQESLQLLTSQEKFHINLGLDRMLKIAELFDNPQEKLKIIHVAGTNGIILKQKDGYVRRVPLIIFAQRTNLNSTSG